MRNLALVFVLALSGCAVTEPLLVIPAKPAVAAKTVEVRGRTWTVSQVGENPDSFTASRDNNNLNPFGRPAARRSPQAAKAIELATGCQVLHATLWQDTTARFYADVACK